jgi:signal recognition particle subunit SRP72
LDPSDNEARQVKLFLLLQTEQNNEALDLIDSEELGHCAFERAYTLYRLQREAEARDILEEVRKVQDDRGAAHLDAQLVKHFGLLKII